MSTSRINYKLALELKKAGFPQGDISSLPQERYWIKEEVCYIPTLSELIEVCGKEFICLERLGEGEDFEWFTEESVKDDYKRHYGKTPEEAVANLYIKLNS